MREAVEVIEGNAEFFAELCNSLPFVHRYTSCTVGWAREDRPTPAQIRGMLSEIKSVAFAGLDESRFATFSVLHTEQDGSKNLHILFARVDLLTKKSFNVAPPGWEASFDQVRDAWNYECGWARPDDPDRARPVQPGKTAMADASAIRQGLQKPGDAKEKITAYLLQKIGVGLVTTRADVVAALANSAP